MHGIFVRSNEELNAAYNRAIMIGAYITAQRIAKELAKRAFNCSEKELA